MNHASGRIVSASGDRAVVEFARTDACDKCRACSMHETAMRIELPNDIGARPGDTVSVLLESGQVAKASAIGYLVPLAGLLAGLAIGIAAFGDVGGAIGGVAGLAISAAVQLRVVEPWLRRRDAFHPRLVREGEAPPGGSPDDGADSIDRKG